MLVQEKRNSIANALEYVFLALTYRNVNTSFIIVKTIQHAKS